MNNLITPSLDRKLPKRIQIVKQSIWPIDTEFRSSARGIVSWFAFTVSFFSGSAFSETTVLEQSPIGPIKVSQVDFSKFEKTFSYQRQSEWCWAASIANIFAFYNHPVSQEAIVMTVYGTDGNFPARTARQIAELVNREWTDTNGKTFRAKLTGAYDLQAGGIQNISGQHDFNNSFIVNELDHERPFLICNREHCMVVTSVTYGPGPDIRVVDVFDPYPGEGPRPLTLPDTIRADRLVPIPPYQPGNVIFVGTLAVSDVLQTGNYPEAASTPSTNESGGSGDDRMDLQSAGTLDALDSTAFHASMRTLIRAAKNDFESIRGKELPDLELSHTLVFDSTINLPHGQGSGIEIDSLTNRPNLFHCTFLSPNSNFAKNEQYAIGLYSKLVENIKHSVPSEWSLTEVKEEGGLTDFPTTTFFAKDAETNTQISVNVTIQCNTEGPEARLVGYEINLNVEKSKSLSTGLSNSTK